jgi:RNA ligase (TIGR02306 family)
MSERKLASVRRILSLDPIPEADLIETATVDGWQVVVQKAIGHKVGDLVCYFEIDSFLPVCEQFEFLRKSSYRNVPGLGEGFRLRTIKLKKQVSQGLIIPLRELTYEGKAARHEEGDDLTEALGVIKYDPPLPACLQGRARGNFPMFIPKSDQDRIQNVYRRVDLDQIWEASLKLDGSSMTAYIKAEKSEPFDNGDAWVQVEEYRTGVCSRNLELKIDEENAGNSFVAMFNKLDLDRRMRALREQITFDFAIQGELMGPGIQGNREKFEDFQFFLFEVYDITNKKKLSSAWRNDFAGVLGLKQAPILGYMNLKGMTVNEILEYADGVTAEPIDGHQWNKIPEGVVFKSENDPNVSFKGISNRFLMKCEE